MNDELVALVRVGLANLGSDPADPGSERRPVTLYLTEAERLRLVKLAQDTGSYYQDKLHTIDGVCGNPAGGFRRYCADRDAEEAANFNSVAERIRQAREEDRNSGKPITLQGGIRRDASGTLCLTTGRDMPEHHERRFVRVPVLAVGGNRGS
jgi:hypothetical protein